MNVTKLRPQGVFLIKHYNKAGKLIGVYRVPNGIVDVGMEDLLGVYFQASSQSTLWYIALVDNAGFGAFAAADTMASHAGWAEGEDYTEGTRPQWTVGAPSSRQITNAVTVDFSINATDTLRGIFITDDNTKGGAIGILWATAAFSSTVAVTSGDTLKITYTVSG